MGANNWAKCPKCLKIVQNKKDILRKRAFDGYGKLPPEEYERLLLESKEPINLDCTLREDYEIYMDEDGYLTIEYSASCNLCGFSCEFNHSEQMKI